MQTADRENLSCTSNDAKSFSALFVHVHVCLEGQANNLEGGTLGEEAGHQRKERVHGVSARSRTCLFSCIRTSHGA